MTGTEPEVFAWWLCLRGINQRMAVRRCQWIRPQAVWLASQFRPGRPESRVEPPAARFERIELGISNMGS